MYCDKVREICRSILQYNYSTCDTALGWERRARGTGAAGVGGRGARSAHGRRTLGRRAAGAFGARGAHGDQEFLELKQGAMTVMDYVARFTELARFADDYVATDLAKVRRFENGLKLSIRARIVGLRLQDMDSMVGTTLTIEREIEDARSTQDAGARRKRKDNQSSSIRKEVESF